MKYKTNKDLEIIKKVNIKALNNFINKYNNDRPKDFNEVVMKLQNKIYEIEKEQKKRRK